MKILKRSFSIVAATLAMASVSVQAHAAPFDQQFIDSMVPHHQSAVMMAQMAVKKAPHAEVRKMARGMIRAQNKEITQLKSWRKAWYGSAVIPMDMKMSDGEMSHGKMAMPGEMMGLPMKMEMDMGKLMRLSGRAFESEFLRMMVPHHAGAVMMAQEALNVTGRTQIRTLSHNIIDSQAKEVGELQAIHNRYYGKL